MGDFSEKALFSPEICIYSRANEMLDEGKWAKRMASSLDKGGACAETQITGKAAC
jgi:hypothetical protein